MPYVARQVMLDAGFATHGVQRYWKSGYADELSDDVIDVAVEAAAEFPSPMAAIAFFHMHGAAARVAPDARAFALRRVQWDVNVMSQWLDPAQSELQIAWVRRVWERMEPLTSGGAYINHIAADDRPEKVRASYGSNYERLVALKRKYDPTNLFRLNQNIPPRA
jgi:FAD/FMN-containing dehydrogenase